MAQSLPPSRQSGRSARAFAGAADRWSSILPGIDHQILLLRWLALLIVIVLHWFGLLPQ